MLQPKFNAINALITTVEWVGQGLISAYGTVKIKPSKLVYGNNGNLKWSIPLL